MVLTMTEPLAELDPFTPYKLPEGATVEDINNFFNEHPELPDELRQWLINSVAEAE